VKAVWDLNDLPTPPSSVNAAGLMSVRYTGQASGGTHACSRAVGQGHH
jgi:hypothetical protein